MCGGLLSKIFTISCISWISLYFLSNAGHKLIDFNVESKMMIMINDRLLSNLRQGGGIDLKFVKDSTNTERKYGSPLCKMYILSENDLPR